MSALVLTPDESSYAHGDAVNVQLFGPLGLGGAVVFLLRGPDEAEYYLGAAQPDGEGNADLDVEVDGRIAARVELRPDAA